MMIEPGIILGILGFIAGFVFWRIGISSKETLCPECHESIETAVCYKCYNYYLMATNELYNENHRLRRKKIGRIMKLFVAGTDSPNPEEWTIWDEVSLLLAENKEQAKTITDKRPIVEVNMDKAALLCSFSEPALGEDL